jgi:hypothetical protein
MLVDQLTINDAAGAHTTLTALLIVVALAVVIVLPPLGYLLWLTQTETSGRAEVKTAPTDQTNTKKENTVTAAHPGIAPLTSPAINRRAPEALSNEHRTPDTP